MQRFFDAQADWTGEYDAAALNRRRRFIGRCGCAWRWTFTSMLREVRYGRQRYVDRYLRPFADSFEHESLVWNTTQAGELIRLSGKAGDDALDRQRRHEAIRLYDETRALMELENQNPMEPLREKFEGFISFLTNALFEPGGKRIAIHTYHDREDSYRVRSFSFDEPLAREMRGSLLERHNKPVPCRLYQSGGAQYFVALRDRIKNNFDTWLKMQKQVCEGRPHPHQIKDRCGLQFIVPTVEIADELHSRICDLVTAPPRRHKRATIEEVVNNLTADEHVANRHSSRFFRAIRLCIRWDGYAVEIQITTFSHYYSSVLAVSEENHEVYRLLQGFDYYFPFLFPTAIYGIDWANKQLRRQLMAFQIAHLGWRVDRDTLPVHLAIM